MSKEGPQGTYVNPQVENLRNFDVNYVDNRILSRFFNC